MKMSLAGQWMLDAPDGGRQEVTVPGCWEAEGYPKDLSGPFWFERVLEVPEALRDRRLWLRFEGVSYHAEVYLDDVFVGEHVGAWDAFEVEVTKHLSSKPSVLRVRVEKPASLRNGPASESVPGRYPMKETLAGFLPYVWGHLFGGIWQQVWLVGRSQVAVEDAFIRADASGRFVAEVRLTSSAPLVLEVVAPSDETVATVRGDGRDVRLEGEVAGVTPWMPNDPALYTARICIGEEVVHAWRFGFRTFETDGTVLKLNGAAIYPRMALSWGWYTNTLHSNPGSDRVRDDLLRLKALGYNGVKLCLWVPPQYYFELADELGMLLWLELPMWLPRITTFFRQQTPVEYQRIVRQVRQHPSLIIYSLGCELNREVDADLLRRLYNQTKALVGEALLRDNSGSGEAYGGLLNEFADYYDYHFYSDLQFFGQLVDAFAPRWRPVQPWVFGEFCDLDTFRNLPELYRSGKALPWWTADDPAHNPQGARWQYDLPYQEARLKENGFWERSAELERISNKQALLHRKFTLELVRTYREISGYVITGESDTPISTAGMWNDQGEFKFAPDAFHAFNNDLTLCLGWDKRREWRRGGDRAAFWDTFSYAGGAHVRAHLIASNYSQSDGPGTLSWEVRADALVASGTENVVVRQGDVREVTVAEFKLPKQRRPVKLRLAAELDIGGSIARNAWNLWCFPEEPWKDVAPFALIDPAGRLAGLEALAPVQGSNLSADLAAVATNWDAELEAFVRGGGHLLFNAYGERTDPFPTVEVPFWREAVKILESHPAWGDFPHDDYADLQFYGMATDLALDTSHVLGARPILRRMDARTGAVHDYAVEVPLGRGHVIATSLRFGGGLGNQPSSIQANIAAAHLLSRFTRYLQRDQKRAAP